MKIRSDINEIGIIINALILRVKSVGYYGVKIKITIHDNAKARQEKSRFTANLKLIMV